MTAVTRVNPVQFTIIWISDAISFHLCFWMAHHRMQVSELDFQHNGSLYPAYISSGLLICHSSEQLILLFINKGKVSKWPWKKNINLFSQSFSIFLFGYCFCLLFFLLNCFFSSVTTVQGTNRVKLSVWNDQE